MVLPYSLFVLQIIITTLVLLFVVGSASIRTHSHADHETFTQEDDDFHDSFDHHHQHFDSGRNVFDDCSCHVHDGSGARIAYLISLHNDRSMEDAIFLFRSIRSPTSIILIHVDKKYYETNNNDNNKESSSMLLALKEETESCSCGAAVKIVSEYDCRWGSWSMNEPTHWSMRELLTNPLFHDEWDVYINISGDTLPVYRPQVLSDLLGGPLAGINFVTSSSCETGLVPTDIHNFPDKWHKKEHYRSFINLTYHEQIQQHESTTNDVKVPIHFGSQWMILQKEFVEFLVQDMKDPDSISSQLKNNLIKRQKLMSDETFIPTLLMYWKDKFTIPTIDPKTGRLLVSNDKHDLPWPISNIRFERMDEHTPSAFGYISRMDRYDVADTQKVDQPRSWGPYYLGVYDLHEIRHSGALFIRKVTHHVDENLHHLLPVNKPQDIPDIGWPAAGVKIQESIYRQFLNIRRLKQKEDIEKGKKQKEDDEKTEIS